nr:helix-turn-helix domain-containing protein [Ancylobacter defluvii]
MLWLNELGWGVRRIARELGCSHMTVRRYVAAGRVGAREGDGAGRRRRDRRQPWRGRGRPS